MLQSTFSVQHTGFLSCNITDFWKCEYWILCYLCVLIKSSFAHWFLPILELWLIRVEPFIKTFDLEQWSENEIKWKSNLPDSSINGGLGRLLHTESCAWTDRKYFSPQWSSERKVHVSLVLSSTLCPVVSAVTMYNSAVSLAFQVSDPTLGTDYNIVLCSRSICKAPIKTKYCFTEQNENNTWGRNFMQK